VIRSNQKTVDVKAIVAHFGGKHQIVNDYEKLLKVVISVKAVEKWLERKEIAMKHILNLKTIAEKRNMNFVFEEYVS